MRYKFGKSRLTKRAASPRGSPIDFREGSLIRREYCASPKRKGTGNGTDSVFAKTVSFKRRSVDSRLTERPEDTE
jgi:hypothetical protein